MSLDRVGALRAERDAVVEFCRDLSAEEWASPSRCEGWSVQDVVAHMGAAYHGTFGLWVVKLMRSKDVEAGNDRDAELRRGWSPERVLREYERWSKRFLAIGGLLQAPPMASIPIRLAEVGTYPARMLASALTFDHYLHLRYDLAGALARPVPPAGSGVLPVVLEWMWAGLPTMSGPALSWLSRSVTITLQGPEGGTWSVVPTGGSGVKVVDCSVDDAAARITGDSETFPVWGTNREPWREAALKIEGDEDLATRLLDSMRII